MPQAVQQAEAGGGFLRSVSKRLLGGVGSGSVAPMAAPGPASGLLEDRPSPGHAPASRAASSAGPSQRATLTGEALAPQPQGGSRLPSRASSRRSEPGPQPAATQAWEAQGDGSAPSQPRSRSPSASGGAFSSASLMQQQQGVRLPPLAGSSRRSLYGAPMGSAGQASSSVGVLTPSSSLTLRCPLPDTLGQLFGADPAIPGLPGGPVRGAEPSHLH